MRLLPWLAIASTILLATCKKSDNEIRRCWDVFDPALSVVVFLDLCDKTRSEAEALYPNGWIYPADEYKYCWRVELNGVIFYKYAIPQLVVDRYMQQNPAYIFTKLADCSSYCTLVWWERHKSKITNEYKPIRSIKETIESKDSCSRLSPGRIVVIRETVDSIITRELHLKTQ